MIRSMIRTFRGPSRDPRMAFISRPLPRGLTDEEVLAALEIALEENPDGRYLVETLKPALQQVTGREYEILDRSVGDVTGTFTKPMVMIRDGSVGLWPGYEARAYPLIAPSAQTEQARRAIAEASGHGEPKPSPTDPVGKPGWAPPPPVGRASAATSSAQEESEPAGEAEH